MHMRSSSNLVFLSSHDLYWRTTATVDSCTCKLQTARAPTSTRANGEQKHRAQQSFSFLRLDCNGGTPLPLSSPPLPSWPLRKVQHVGLVPNQRVPPLSDVCFEFHGHPTILRGPLHLRAPLCDVFPVSHPTNCRVTTRQHRRFIGGGEVSVARRRFGRGGGGLADRIA